MDSQPTTSQEKALKINLDPVIYGTLAEIGAGQEVARTFFRAGGASRTIAKSMCAYDMTFSDEIYGKSPRYVSRERLHRMLDHEYGLLIERLGRQRGERTCFFAFANTVATTSYGSDRDGHGWLGIRFQTSPGGASNEIILHCQLLDRDNSQQQIALGSIGTSLIHAAFFLRKDLDALLRSLLDEIGHNRAEIDMLEFRGTAFSHIDNRMVALKLVQLGLTNAALFSPDGTMLQPASALYKKAILVERGSFRPITKVSIDMLETAERTFLEDPKVAEAGSITLLEITLNNLLATGSVDTADFLARVDTIGALGYHVLISNYPEYYRLGAFLRRYTGAPIGIVIGINNLLEIFNPKYYQHLEGRILEGFGRLFKNNVKLYAYPMHREGLRHYRRFSMLETWLENADRDAEELPEIVTAENLRLSEDLKYLYAYLLNSGFIISLAGYETSLMGVFSRDILAAIAQNDPTWADFVPEPVADLIRKRGLFGHPGTVSLDKE